MPLAHLLHAAIKRGKAVVRSIGLAQLHPDWQSRAETCMKCPLCTTACGKQFCGRPFLQQTHRDEPTEGCGCPVLLKARDPVEHCPRDDHFGDPRRPDGTCGCTWCAAGLGPTRRPTTPPVRASPAAVRRIDCAA